MEVENCQVVKEGMESRDGIVVMVLASHLLDPFSATSGLSWFLVLYSAPRGFSPGSPTYLARVRPLVG